MNALSEFEAVRQGVDRDALSRSLFALSERARWVWAINAAQNRYLERESDELDPANTALYLANAAEHLAGALADSLGDLSEICRSENTRVASTTHEGGAA